MEYVGYVKDAEKILQRAISEYRFYIGSLLYGKLGFYGVILFYSIAFKSLVSKVPKYNFRSIQVQ